MENNFQKVGIKKYTYLSIDRVKLLQGSQYKDSRFTHTRFSLTQDVHSEDGLRYTFMLNFTIYR